MTRPTACASQCLFAQLCIGVQLMGNVPDRISMMLCFIVVTLIDICFLIRKAIHEPPRCPSARIL